MSTPEERKLTVGIDPEEYRKFTKDMQHGQVSHILRKFVSIINQMFSNGKRDKVNAWVYGNETLTLNQEEEE